jgi:hypothetical protein
MKRICHLKDRHVNILLSTNENIVGMTYVPDFEGIFFVTDKNGDLNFLGMDKFRDVFHKTATPIFDRVVYSPDGKTLWMTSNDPFQIYFYEIFSRAFVPVLGKYAFGKYGTYIESPAVFDSNFNSMAYDLRTGTAFVASPKKHCVIKVCAGTVDRCIGDGTVGFRYASIPKSFHMNSPSGIGLDKKNRTLYVSDTGNHVIYAFGIKNDEQHELYLKKTYGNPLSKGVAKNSFFFPTTIFYQNNILWVVDNKLSDIKRFDLETGTGTTVYTSTTGKIFDIDSIGESELIWLEDS